MQSPLASSSTLVGARLGVRRRVVRCLAPLTALALPVLANCGSSEASRNSTEQVAPNEALRPAAGGSGSQAPEMPSSGSSTEGGPSGDIGLVTPAMGEPAPDEVVTDVNVEVHPDVNTLLVVTWTQTAATDNVWLEFSFEDGNSMTSRPASGAVGEHRDVVIGVPGDTLVTLRIVLEKGGERLTTRDYQGTTDPLPGGMPVPEVLTYDPALATSDRWLFGSVEDSDGGCNSQNCYYHTTFWLYIMDRQGRIVWYYADPASNATTSFQRIARDGEYIVLEKRPFGGGGQRGVLEMTLDGSYRREIAVPGLADAIDVTESGSLLYNVDGQNAQLRERSPDGQIRGIWSCRQAFGANFQCYSNTINYNPLGDTVLMSFPYHNTVVEIDRESGALVGQYGDAPGSWTFSPPTWQFEFQHFANITPEGTLLVSSHMPGFADTESPVANQHAFMEFEIDRQNQRLVEKWIYNEGPEWAMYKGMAIRLPGGNTLANYGTGGVIREITPDKQTAFMVKFDAEAGNDFFNKMVGHNVLIDDLYALNGGPPPR
jgi:hypothetical protein